MGNNVSFPKKIKIIRRNGNESNEESSSSSSLSSSSKLDYMVKNSDVQIDRIQQMHNIFKTCCDNKNFFAPVSKELSRGIKVLDVGSGPGTWVFDMSSDYKKSEFIGIELQANMLPTVHPSNTKFIHNNILEGIPYPPNSFDYIHMRCMTLCFTEKQYEQVIGELIVLLKPKGYLEVSELEVCSANMGPVCERLSTEMGNILRMRSMNPFINEQLGEMLNSLGLQNVKQDDVQIPASELDGPIGALYGEMLYNGLIGVKDTLAKQMGLSKSEMDSLLEDYRNETKTRRMYNKLTRAYGRKIIKK